MLADAADHHPDLKINYNKIEVRLATHSANGITDKDFGLAKKFDTAFGE
jgi:pterin-4a-carbinolamine dehydratase